MNNRASLRSLLGDNIQGAVVADHHIIW